MRSGIGSLKDWTIRYKLIKAPGQNRTKIFLKILFKIRMDFNFKQPFYKESEL